LQPIIFCTMDDDEPSTNKNGESTVVLQSMYQWFITMVIVAIKISQGVPLEQNPSVVLQKLIWNNYIISFLNKPNFVQRHLRMSLHSFYKLSDLIHTQLEVDHEKANSRGGPLLPEICLFCTFHWLARVSYLDIYAITKVSIASFYCVVNRTLMAINTCPLLQNKFPTTMQECKSAANGYRGISTKEAITNCIADLYPTKRRCW
jgi:hypothetical protein